MELINFLVVTVSERAVPQMPKVIYIAGPITGVVDYSVAFTAAETKLKSRGDIVFNPAILPEGLSFEAYMPICYAMLDQSNTIYLMRGWRNSKGAKMEYEYAVAKGMKIMFESEKQHVE